MVMYTLAVITHIIAGCMHDMIDHTHRYMQVANDTVSADFDPFF